MRAEEIEVGLECTLIRARRRRRVTAVETPEDLRRRGMVRLRYVDGIKQGELTDQQLRFVRSRWGEAPPERQRPDPKPSKVIEAGSWPPEQGDRVLWRRQTGEIEWTVAAVDLSRGTARLIGDLFTRELPFTAPLSEIEPLEIEIEPETEPPSTPTRPRSGPEPRLAEPEEEDRRTPLERVIERLSFSAECLRQYKSEFEPTIPWPQIAKRLERELRNRGKLIKRDPTEYVRVRTRRFDVSVSDAPTDSEPFLVEKLAALPGHRAKRRRRRRSGSR